MAVAQGDRMRILLLSILALGCTNDGAQSPDLSTTLDLADRADLGNGDLAGASDLAEANDLGKQGDMARPPGDMAMAPPPITARPIWIGSGGSPWTTLNLCVGGFDVTGESAAPSGAHLSGGFCSFQTY
jgi:hypothetical protein